jgi:hypothetical protein
MKFYRLLDGEIIEITREQFNKDDEYIDIEVDNDDYKPCMRDFELHYSFFESLVNCDY